MKIKALRRFEDFKEKVTREIGDEFEVTEERLEELKTNLSKFGEGDWVLEVVEDPAPKSTPEVAPKETAKETPKGKA